MPTKEELNEAAPKVKGRLRADWDAYKARQKTRAQVAEAAMKLAEEPNATDAAKLLLMKGAFVLYVRDGKPEKAAEVMKALEAAIADMPPQSVSNMVDLALLGVSKQDDRERLCQLLGASKRRRSWRKRAASPRARRRAQVGGVKAPPIFFVPFAVSGGALKNCPEDGKPSIIPNRLLFNLARTLHEPCNFARYLQGSCKA